MVRYETTTITATLSNGETERWVIDTGSDDAVRVTLSGDAQPYDLDIQTAPAHPAGAGQFNAGNYVSCLPLGAETYTDTNEHTTATDVVDESVYVEITNNSGGQTTFTGTISTHSQDARDSVQAFTTEGTSGRASAYRDGKALGNSESHNAENFNTDIEITDSDDLDSRISEIGSGDVVRIHPGNYTISQLIVDPSLADVTIIAYGATITRESGSGSSSHFIGAYDGLTVLGGEYDGNGTNASGDHVLRFDGGTDCLAQDVYAHDGYAGNFYMGGGATDCTIRDSRGIDSHDTITSCNVLENATNCWYVGCLFRETVSGQNHAANLVYGATESGYINCRYEGGSVQGLHMEGDAHQCQVIGCISTAQTGFYSTNSFTADGTVMDDITAAGCGDSGIVVRGNGFDLGTLRAYNCGNWGVEFDSSTPVLAEQVVADNNTTGGVNFANAYRANIGTIITRNNGGRGIDARGIGNGGGFEYAAIGRIWTEANDAHGVYLRVLDGPAIIGQVFAANNDQGGNGADGFFYFDSQNVLVGSVLALDNQSTATQRYGVNGDPNATNVSFGFVRGSGNASGLINPVGTRIAVRGTIEMGGAPSGSNFSEEHAGLEILDSSTNPDDLYKVRQDGTIAGPL